MPGSAHTTQLVAQALDQALNSLARGNLRSMDSAVDTMTNAPVSPREDAVSSMVVSEMSRRLRAAWRNGWQPADVVSVARRKWGPVHGDIVAAAVVDDAKLDAQQPMHPQWAAQLDSLEPWWELRHRPTHAWLNDVAAIVGLARRDIIERCVEVVHHLSRLVVMPTLIPPPGPGAALAARGGALPSGDLDVKVLAKVRALLAKAESTDFPEEADSLTAKAQEFMTRHSIDAAMLDARASVHDAPAGRRIHLEAPYVDAKATLVGAVASPNRCRVVLAPDLGFVTLFGYPGDLQVVDVLFTSLLSQATTAMVAAGRVLDRAGTSKTRSFRHSFLVAYASRIAERLSEAAQHSAHEAELVHGQSMLPVLVKREEAVEEAVAEAFPRMKRRTQRVSSRAGWEAGQLAADQASLGPWTQVKRGPA